MTQDTKTDLQKHVDQIAQDINAYDWGESHDYVEGDEGDNVGTAIDYLSDALDIEWVISSDKQTLLGARVLVAFGGPNIWINTKTGTVEGYWWNESAFASFEDNAELDDALECLFGC